jgi:hypothetical protein
MPDLMCKGSHLKNRNNRGKNLFLLLISSLLAILVLSTELSAQKISAPKEETIWIRGRVVASVGYLSGYLRGGFGDHYQVFVVDLDPKAERDPVTLVKIMYKFFYKAESPLPDSFFDSSKRYEMQVFRDSSCDETLQNLSYQKNEDETGKQLPPTYILRPLDGAPKDIFRPDSVLPCYVLRPGGYKLLKSREGQ